MKSVLRVMPLTRLAPDVLCMLTISLVALLVLLGFVCIIYSIYFRSHVRRHGFIQFSYFSGPWIIRIVFILVAIWWGLGEIIRLSLLRREGEVFNTLDPKWQENVCKGYIVSNLGFAEPCLFLTLLFLLRAPLQKKESGTLSGTWNWKTACYVLLFCLPVFLLQLLVILTGSRLNKSSVLKNLPHYFTRTASLVIEDQGSVALCTYPLLSIILLGVFATILTVYLFWLGRQILKLVINKCLQKRVYTLILSVSSFLPLRVILLGLSVLTKPQDMLFEALAFLAFLALLCCASVSIFTLVYFPVSDSLALQKLDDLESRNRVYEDRSDTTSLISNKAYVGLNRSDTASLISKKAYIGSNQFVLN